MAMGPRLKPSALAAPHGRTNHARKRVVDEPLPTGELVDPPSWLTPEQCEGWRYALANSPPGMLKALDRAMLVVWVVAEDLHKQAAVALAKEEVMIPAGPGWSQTGVNPWHSVLHRQASVMRQVSAELGFSPAARPRLAGQPKAPDFPQPPKAKGKARVSLREYLERAPTRGLMS